MTATIEAPTFNPADAPVNDRTIGDLRGLLDAGLGVNANERIFILAMLDSEEPLKMSEAAEIVGISRATMTAMADRLELDKTIRRVPSVTDRRVTALELTAKGRKKAFEALSS